MTLVNNFINKDVLQYIKGINKPLHPVLLEIESYNQKHRLGNMMLSFEQINFLIWLAKLIKAKNYLEIGVYTGFSSTAMALSLPSDALITACDINVTYTDIAKKFWIKAKVDSKIDLHLQPALITLEQLIHSGIKDYYDIALIDADKIGIPYYIDYCYKLIKQGGIIIVDNILLQGKVLTINSNSSNSTKTMFDFSNKLKYDNRFDYVALSISDGIILLLKK